MNHPILPQKPQSSEGKPYPSFVKTEEDRRLYEELLKRMPSDEDLEAIATKPSPEWLAQRALKQ